MELWTRWCSSCSATWNRVARATALFLIDVYRTNLSAFTGVTCRFEPSCSCYAHEAFKIHPPHTAFFLTFKRLLRCRPFGPYGYDPVPERNSV